MAPMKNIYLIGFMATGKTAVGKVLATRLGREFIDLDEAIEKKEQMKITDIFAQRGEPYFRTVEKAVLREAAAHSGRIVACGGGVVIDPENVATLKGSGVIICLEAEPDTIVARSVGTAERPLLNVENPRERVMELLKKREPFYKQADHIIDTTKLSVDAVAERIIAIIKKTDTRA